MIGGIWEKLETILPVFYQQSYFSLRFHICQLNFCICSFTILLIICNGVYICICICTCICICNNVPLTKNCSGIYERICKSLVWVSALWVHQNFKTMTMKFCLKWHLIKVTLLCLYLSLIHICICFCIKSQIWCVWAR